MGSCLEGGQKKEAVTCCACKGKAAACSTMAALQHMNALDISFCFCTLLALHTRTCWASQRSIQQHCAAGPNGGHYLAQGVTTHGIQCSPSARPICT
jgi:hypothetical protein